jgi:hypothetical protein
VYLKGRRNNERIGETGDAFYVEGKIRFLQILLKYFVSRKLREHFTSRK